MNFWEFKEDYSRGYYLPVSNKTAYKQGGQLVTGLFFLIANLFKLAGAILMGIAAFLILIFGRLWKLIRS
ncbi:MAG: hypothetical protein QM594_16420 [Niabella sp.]